MSVPSDSYELRLCYLIEKDPALDFVPIASTSCVSDLRDLIFSQSFRRPNTPLPKHLNLFKVDMPLVSGANFGQLTKDSFQVPVPMQIWEPVSLYWSKRESTNRSLNVFVTIGYCVPDTKKREGLELQSVVHKRVRLNEELSDRGEAGGMDVSDVGHGGKDTPPQKVALDNAIQRAKSLLKHNSQSLKLAATTDAQTDIQNPFFVDGIGALYDIDHGTKGRVDNLFRPGKARVLLNTSGSGKTRLLVEGLCKHWGVYFTADPDPGLGSIDLNQSIEKIGTIMSFSKDLPNSPRRRNALLGGNQCIARTVLLTVLLARLLVLEEFLQVGKSIQVAELRRRWTHLQVMPSVLHSQFSGKRLDLFNDVYATMKDFGEEDNDTVNSLFTEACQASLKTIDSLASISPLFIVIDEAQYLTDQYLGTFHSDTDTGPTGARSVLREIFVAWGRAKLGNTLVVLSGTDFSLTKVLTSMRSSMGVVNDSVFHDVGAFVKQKDQAAYITRHVTLDDDIKEQVLRLAWQWLRGRHRWTVTFVYILKHCSTGGNALGLLARYVRDLTGRIPSDLSDISIARLTQEKEMFYPPVVKISKYLQRLDAHASLRQDVVSAITTFMLKHSPHLFEGPDVVTVELGIARYKTYSEANAKSIIIDEPIIIATMLEYLESRPESIEGTLCGWIKCLPKGPARGSAIEVVGMYAFAKLLDGTRSLDEIFDFKTDSKDLRTGRAVLIAIHKINADGTFCYSIVKEPWLYPFGMGFDANDPSDHKKWLKGIGVPFCFPDTRSGHDIGFFVLVNGRVVFVIVQMKSHSTDLNKTITEGALRSVTPEECYKDKNGKIYQPSRSTRKKMHKVLEHAPCLSVLASFPSRPHSQTIEEKAPEHFALFDLLKAKGKLGEMLAAFQMDQFPELVGPKLPNWPVEDECDVGPSGTRVKSAE